MIAENGRNREIFVGAVNEGLTSFGYAITSGGRAHHGQKHGGMNIGQGSE
jgi:hypothetical protein